MTNEAGTGKRRRDGDGYSRRGGTGRPPAPAPSLTRTGHRTRALTLLLAAVAACLPAVGVRTAHPAPLAAFAAPTPTAVSGPFALDEAGAVAGTARFWQSRLLTAPRDGAEHRAVAESPASIAPTAQGGDQALRAAAIIAFSEALQAATAGDYDLALAKYAEARTLYQQLGDAGGEATMLDGAAGIHERMGNYAQALALREEALDVAREGGAAVAESDVLKGQSQLYYRLGQYTQARDLAQQALAVARDAGRRATAAGDRLEAIRAQSAEAAALSATGIAAHGLGDFAGALSAYFERLTIIHARIERARAGEEGISLLANQAGELQTLNGIGSVYADLEQYDRALDYFKQAFNGAIDLGDIDGAITYQNNIAYVLWGQGKLDDAQALYEEALDVVRRRDDPATERVILDNLGGVAADRGRLDTALSLFEQSLAIARRLGDQAGEMLSLNNMAHVRQLSGDPMAAIDLYQQALTMARDTGARAAELTVLSNLAIILDRQGHLEEALASDRQAIAVAEDIRTLARIDELKASAANRTAATYAHAVGLLVRLGRSSEAFDMAERGRARTLLDQLGSNHADIVAGADPNLVAEERSLRTEIAAIDLQMRGLLARRQTASVRNQVDGLRAQLTARQTDYERLLTRLKLASPEAASLIAVEPAPLAAIQARLNDETALLSYFVTASRTFAFIVTRTGIETVTLAVEEQDVRKANTELRDFSNIRGQAVPAPGLTRLYDWLIAPLAARLTAPVIGIVPHGILYYVPFAALSDGHTYFGEMHTLFHLPSAATLPYVQDKRRDEMTTALVLAQSRAESLPPLRYAEEEAKNVAAYFDAVPVVGAGATETIVKTRSADYNVLHIAAHGELNPVSPLFSRIFLEPDAENDGSLTVLDVYGLHLSKASLVVLSACESQLGIQSRGDDVIGLNRAFIYAGAPSVIGSLWSVNDKATALLMQSLYRHLSEGLPKAAALQAAQADTRAQYPHPFYWAPFIITGDPGR